MTLQITVPNMACSACSDAIAQAIQAIDPTAKVQVTLKTKQINVASQATEREIKQAITDAGYTVA